MLGWYFFFDGAGGTVLYKEKGTKAAGRKNAHGIFIHKIK
jgi:hypothetical protein